MIILLWCYFIDKIHKEQQFNCNKIPSLSNTSKKSSPLTVSIFLSPSFSLSLSLSPLLSSSHPVSTPSDFFLSSEIPWTFPPSHHSPFTPSTSPVFLLEYTARILSQDSCILSSRIFRSWIFYSLINVYIFPYRYPSVQALHSYIFSQIIDVKNLLY